MNSSSTYKEKIDALVNRFLGWPLPKTVCSDTCVTDPNYKYPRFGTNLLNANETRQMIEYLLQEDFPQEPSTGWEKEFKKRFVWKHTPEGRGYLYDVVGEQTADEVIIADFFLPIIEQAYLDGDRKGYVRRGDDRFEEGRREALREVERQVKILLHYTRDIPRLKDETLDARELAFEEVLHLLHTPEDKEV